jgi:hypothetical protein
MTPGLPRLPGHPTQAASPSYCRHEEGGSYGHPGIPATTDHLDIRKRDALKMHGRGNRVRGQSHRATSCYIELAIGQCIGISSDFIELLHGMMSGDYYGTLDIFIPDSK